MFADDKAAMFRLAHRGPDVLPTTHDRLTQRTPHWLRWHNRRYTRIAFFALVALAVLALFRTTSTADIVPYVEDLPEFHIYPPLYEKYHARELQLPQHDPDLPLPEGREGKYIWMANHVHASGWGNAMQELLLNSYLAYGSGRSFVFDNYTWNRDGSDYTDYNGKLIPSRIPLSAIMSGPTIGGPFPPGDPAPRAVTKEYFDEVCPHPTVIHSDEVSSQLPGDSSAQMMFDKWIEKLRTADRCVEIDRDSLQIFSIWIFGSRRVLDIYDSLTKSPILSDFRWSPLIESAFETNRPIFSPASGLEPYIPALPWFGASSNPYPPLPGLLVLHVRRGDFASHCEHLARWSSDWNGFNQFPTLPDKFERLQSAGWGETAPENLDLYMRRCFPSIEQIVAKVEEVRATPAGRGLRHVYIMTNGAKDWIDELKRALGKTGHFKKVSSSRELRLSWEQKYIAQAVDMLIGQRAQVLIGNGFSSLTSNIVMMRMANNLPPESNRFW